jgi:hypothetical protein
MSRFTIRGNVAVEFLASAPVDLAELTASEVTAATDLTGVVAGEALAEMDGWASSPSTINVPDVKSLTTGNIPGETTFGTATLTYYTDSATNAIWDAQTEGLTGFVAIFPSGSGAGKAYTIFGVQVISRTRMLATGNEAEKHRISYSISSRTEGEQETP